MIKIIKEEYNYKESVQKVGSMGLELPYKAGVSPVQKQRCLSDSKTDISESKTGSCCQEY
jgi:hypothetical protein